MTTLVVVASVDGAGASAGTGGSLMLVPAGSTISPDHSLPASTVSVVVTTVSGVVTTVSVDVSSVVVVTDGSAVSAKTGAAPTDPPRVRQMVSRIKTDRIDFFILHSKTT